jgi:peptidylprolyl isomerase
MTITGKGVAVALAVIVALGFMFFAPFLFTSSNALQTAATATSTGQLSMDSSSTTPSGLTNEQKLSADAATPAMQTLPGGLQIADVQVGTGAEAKAGDHISVAYTGMLTDGTVFDATSKHGGTPIDIDLGAGQVIKGWDQGIVGMKEGGKRRLVIPASLGYGAQAVGPIPANSTLVFDVELVKVQSK